MMSAYLEDTFFCFLAEEQQLEAGDAAAQVHAWAGRRAGESVFGGAFERGGEGRRRWRCHAAATPAAVLHVRAVQPAPPLAAHHHPAQQVGAQRLSSELWWNLDGSQTPVALKLLPLLAEELAPGSARWEGGGGR